MCRKSNAGRKLHHPDLGALVTLEATVSPSEDPSKVAAALAAILGLSADQVEVLRGSARLSTRDPKALTRLRDALRDRHVRSAARRQLLLSTEGSRASLMFNRQAAAAGVVALCGSPGESPLGPVCMVLKSSRLEETIDWLTAYEGG